MPSHQPRYADRTLAILAALLLSACGSGEDQSTTPGSSGGSALGGSTSSSPEQHRGGANTVIATAAAGVTSPAAVGTGGDIGTGSTARGGANNSVPNTPNPNQATGGTNATGDSTVGGRMQDPGTINGGRNPTSSTSMAAVGGMAMGGTRSSGGVASTGTTGGKTAAGGHSGADNAGRSNSGGAPAGGYSGSSSAGTNQTGLGWPIDCVLGIDCTVGYPDIDEDGKAFDCSAPGYTGHQGTDIGISWQMMDSGVDVYAAADGEVLWVFDGHFDRCPNTSEPSCQAPSKSAGANVESGYMVCTNASDQYCLGTSYTSGCYWCFYGANVVVIRHDATVFATRYDHLRRGSIVVTPGQRVTRGQKIAEVGSAGNSTGPHLHFEIWVGGFYRLAEPWAGTCGPNTGPSLWDPSLGLN